MTCTELSIADPLYPRATIDTLPDNVLLETFEFYLGEVNADEEEADECDRWQTLVHVCCRWRCIVFASPHRLDLKLYCTPQRLVNSETLNIWPELPTVIAAVDMQSKEDVTNIIAALRHRNRVCEIYYLAGHVQESLVKELAEINEPFPALTSLSLFPYRQQNVPVLPDLFLGGSAPRLRSLSMAAIPCPSIGNLLSSTTNLVHLYLWSIPHSGYIAPETIVPCLSMLLRLESLQLGFKHPRSLPHRASRHPPLLTRAVFPSLTYFNFRGDIEYLEDVLSQIEIPMLNQSTFGLFNRLAFDTPLLGHFICRTGIFRTIHTARVQFSSWSAMVKLFGREEIANGDREELKLYILCKPLDWQLSAIAQVLGSFLCSLPALESLDIEQINEVCQDDIEVIQWRDFFHPFTSVKNMTLASENSVEHVVPALQELARERAIEVLPALQDLCLPMNSWQPSGPIKDAIEQLINTQPLHGRPVTIHYEETESDSEE